jgi:hypothetical protein
MIDRERDSAERSGHLRARSCSVRRRQIGSCDPPGRDAKSRPWKAMAGATSMEIAGDVNAAMRQFLPDAVFIDAGGPNAGGVIDRLRQLNPEYESIFEINFGSLDQGHDARWNNEVRVKVANKRAQMWTNMRAWLERGIHSRRSADCRRPDRPRIQLHRRQCDPAREEGAHEGARACLARSCRRAGADLRRGRAPRVLPEYLNPGNYGRTPTLGSG